MLVQMSASGPSESSSKGVNTHLTNHSERCFCVCAKQRDFTRDLSSSAGSCLDKGMTSIFLLLV